MRFTFLAAALAIAPAASAQMLPSGTWTGETRVGSRTFTTTAEIERCATGFTVDLSVGGRLARTETATWQSGRLRFTTDRARLPGMASARPLACDLAAGEGGRLAGTCTAGRASYRVALSPPASGTFGCD